MCEVVHRPDTAAWPPILVVVDSDFLVAFRKGARDAVVREVYVAEAVRKELRINPTSSSIRRRLTVCKPRERAVLAKLGLQGRRSQPGLRQALSGADWTVLLATACLISSPPTLRGVAGPAPPIVLLTGEYRITQVAGLDFQLANLPVPSPGATDRRWFFVSNAAGIGAVGQLVQRAGLPFRLP